MRSAALVCFLLASAAAFGQRVVTVHVPPGDVVVFTSAGSATSVPADPIVPKEGTAVVTMEPGKDTLYVWDRSANRATSTVPKAVDWSPKVDDLRDLGQVVISVRHDSKPVAAANVSLNDGKRRQNLLLDPSANGDATFFDVKPGTLKVTVKYRAGNADAAPVTQEFSAPATGSEPPRFTVALPEATATVGGTASTGNVPAQGQPTASGQPTTGAEKGGGGGTNFVGLLVALVVVGGGGALLYSYLRKNPERFGETLEKLGAQIPKPGDADLADPAIANALAPDPPAPPQKIVLDPVAPIDLATPAPAPVVTPTPTSSPLPSITVSEPSLISDSGVPIPLAEGETIVGREIGLGLSLAGESTVSRRHALLVRTGNSVVVEDQGSTNGTFVNGVRTTGSVPLQPGDAVQFGTVSFRYEG